jgi:hypothetical protein
VTKQRNRLNANTIEILCSASAGQQEMVFQLKMIEDNGDDLEENEETEWR